MSYNMLPLHIHSVCSNKETMCNHALSLGGMRETTESAVYKLVVSKENNTVTEQASFFLNEPHVSFMF